MSGVGRGSLVLADISGYTTYLSGVELEHSSDVLADLIGVVVDQMRGTFRLAKLEGDAIFCYAPDPMDRNALVDMIDSAYFAFAGRLAAIARATTCECKACVRIPSLNLKFVAHHGEYVLHEVAGHQELVGSDVVLVHRLLKNSITKKTGVAAYAFFTEAIVSHLEIDAAAVGMVPHQESYRDAGRAGGWVLDLLPRWEAERDRRVVYVGPGDDVLEWSTETSIPPPLAWEYCTNPQKLEMWWSDKEEQETVNGLMGVGAMTHCVHGKQTMHNEIVDYRPYKYFTYIQRGPLGEFLCTNEIAPGSAPDRWRLVARIRPMGGIRQRLALKVIPKARRLMPDALARLERLLKSLESSAAAVAATHAESLARKAPPAKKIRSRSARSSRSV